MAPLRVYRNGNADIELFIDGTRKITYPDEGLHLDWPLNIDIRLSNRCQFGMNPKTGKAVCSFCHESATTNGDSGNLGELLKVLEGIPDGVEIAFGVNFLPQGFEDFLKASGRVHNITLNQGFLANLRHVEEVRRLQSLGLVYGVGVSYRRGYQHFLPDLGENRILHVIAGIDSFNEVLYLRRRGVKKLLVLGEKDFGFNVGKVDLQSPRHREWFYRVSELFRAFDVVSFDNLALEQLQVSRFFDKEKWEVTYQGEHSIYINAVTRTFHPSSRSSQSVSWDETTLQDFFKATEENQDVHLQP